MIKKGDIEIDGTLYAYDIRFIRGKKGDILVKGNREWIRIPAGHDGLVLTSRGEGEIPEWRAGVPGTCDNADKLDGQHGTYYLNRANHTGTQTRSTISDFAHKGTHVSGGSDAFTNTDTIEALVKRIQTQGNVNLDIGTIGDGQFLKRSGTNIIGADPPAGSQVVTGSYLGDGTTGRHIPVGITPKFCTVMMWNGSTGANRYTYVFHRIAGMNWLYGYYHVDESPSASYCYVLPTTNFSDLTFSGTDIVVQGWANNSERTYYYIVIG
jgi:hypothetical protein